MNLIRFNRNDHLLRGYINTEHHSPLYWIAMMVEKRIGEDIQEIFLVIWFP
jgi:hypothetical protein